MNKHDTEDAKRFLVQNFIDGLCLAISQSESEWEANPDGIYSTIEIPIPSKDTIDALLDANKVYRAARGERRLFDRERQFELVRIIMDDLKWNPLKKVTEAIKDAAARFFVSYELARRAYYDKSVGRWAYETKQIYRRRKVPARANRKIKAVDKRRKVLAARMLRKMMGVRKLP
jgi:hypothetical protein